MLASVPYALKAGDADLLGGTPASAFLTDFDVSALEESVAAEAAARAAADNTLQNSINNLAADAITSLNAGTGIAVGGSGNSRTITNTGDPNMMDDITSLNAGTGIAVGGSGNSRTISATGNFGGNVAVAGTLNVGQDLIVDGNLFVSGSKSSTALLPDGRTVALYAVESPENWFEDFGSAELRDGVASIEIDAAFRDTINLGLQYHVFVTPNGDCRGLYVAEKTASGFEVRELGGGTSSVAFDYRIVARRRGFESIRLEEVEVSGSTGGTQ